MFAGFVYSVSQSFGILLFMGIPLALITYLNIKTIRFCQACGRTVMPQMGSAPKFCAKCGAELLESSRPD
ncbi:MAG: hypothetical protein CMF64_08405 [Magnetovibrio sp.]|nr:hypothetical protein [Magnetovibrio sp.]